MTLPRACRTGEEEAPASRHSACFPLLFFQFLNRPFRVVFNLQQNLHAAMFLCGLQRIKKEKNPNLK